MFVILTYDVDEKRVNSGKKTFEEIFNLDSKLCF